MDGEELADVMADAVNSGIDASELRDALRREHPYLQAEVLNQVLLPALEAIANTPRVDARNERAVERCERLLEELEADPGVTR